MIVVISFHIIGLLAKGIGVVSVLAKTNGVVDIQAMGARSEQPPCLLIALGPLARRPGAAVMSIMDAPRP